MSSKGLLIRPHSKGNGYDVSLWMFGHLWSLKTSGATNYWLIKADRWITWLPLKDAETSERIHLKTDIDHVIFQAQYQILRLRYQKTSPTFHEQHIHQFPHTSSVEVGSQEVGTHSEDEF